MDANLLAMLMNWLATGTDEQKQHATARLAMEDAPEYPPLATQAGNALAALGRVASAIVTGQSLTVPDAEQARRMAICFACPLYDPEQVRCTRCGCGLTLKSRIATEHCPDGHW